MNIINEECTFAVCGPVDAGKSSLIGVLTSGELDDGRGIAINGTFKKDSSAKLEAPALVMHKSPCFKTSLRL